MTKLFIEEVFMYPHQCTWKRSQDRSWPISPLAALVATAISTFAGPSATCLEIARGGKATCVIVTADKPDAVTQTAVAELAVYLGRITGASFPVNPEAEVEVQVPQIIVGPCQRLETRFGEKALEGLGHDGILIRSAENCLGLAGAPPRGTLYAVYTFLEDTLGCRWWTSTEETVPSCPDLRIRDLDVSYTPPLRYREAFYRDAFVSPFAARLKINGHFERIPPEYGGHYRILGWCHTFYQLLPPATYFAAHPDWYSEIAGKRTGDRAQLCLTNPAMRAELTAQALAWLRKEPDAGMISISQNDWGGRCECAECRRVEEEEGSPAGPLIQCVNAVAEEIEKEFPDTLVETLAYHYTRHPPKNVRPRDNVVIRLCSIECSFLKPLADSQENEAFRKDILEWRAKAPQLYIWDYVANFRNYILPHPNLQVLGANIRFFVANHAIGLFEQGDAGCSVGDFAALRAWLLAHLMWDPAQNERVLRTEFLRGYYGAAGEALGDYLDLIQKAAEKADVYLRCSMDDTAAWLRLEDLNSAWQLFDRALAAVATDPVLQQRVRRERLSLEHAWLQRYRALQRQAYRDRSVLLGPSDPVAACRDFIEKCREFGVRQYAEQRSFADYAEVLASRFSGPAVPPKTCRGLSDADWVDLQEWDFRLYGIGSWVKVIDDPDASNGKACRMPGDHPQWAVQAPISPDLATKTPWHVSVCLRVEADASAEGAACDLGIYDETDRKGIAKRSLAVSDVSAGGYIDIDLGAYVLHPGLYVWVAPPNRADGVRAVVVDRVYLRRELAAE